LKKNAKALPSGLFKYRTLWFAGLVGTDVNSWLIGTQGDL